MTKPPRRLISVPVQINQYVGGNPSIREARPLLFMIHSFDDPKNITDVLKRKEPLKKLFLTWSDFIYWLIEVLDLKRPFALAHHGLACPVFLESIDVHLRRSDHQVHVVDAGIASCSIELLVS